MSSHNFIIEYVFKREDGVTVIVTTPPKKGYENWSVHTVDADGSCTFVSKVQAQRLRDGGTTIMQGENIKIYSPSSFRKGESAYIMEKEGLAQEIFEQENQNDLDVYDEMYERIESYPKMTIIKKEKTLDPKTIEALSQFYSCANETSVSM